MHMQFVATQEKILEQLSYTHKHNTFITNLLECFLKINDELRQSFRCE